MIFKKLTMDFCENESTDELNSTLTDESQYPVDENYDTKSKRLCEKSRREDLQIRLKNAQEKIEKYEASINEISNDCLKIDTTSSSSLNHERSFHETDIDAKNVISYIEEYIEKLEDEFQSLDSADNQIENMTERVMQEIDNTYDRLLANITKEINQKRNMMKLEAKVFKNESLSPLKACRQQIKSQILNKKLSINQIELKLNDKLYKKKSELDELDASSRNIGGIPAVPSIDELPYLNFKGPSNDEINEILNNIYDLGSIVKLGPVKISDIEEKPGSIYVKWDIDDPDYAGEEHIYVLQKAEGEIYDSTSHEFETVYEGTDNCFFVKNLQVNKPVTLRVGIQSLETAWSLPRFAKTKIRNYEWSQDNKDYMITNNGAIAAKLVDEISTLFSQDAQLAGNQIIEFKFLEVSKNGSNDEGIALINEPKGRGDGLKRQGSLFVTCQGKIFMDGDEKSMQLPRVNTGMTIVFTLLKKDDETLRINIECSDKVVTYDWFVETPLYFATRLAGHNKWNLMVK